MKSKLKGRFLSVLFLLVVMFVGVVSTGVPPARAASFLTVSLDSSSTSQTDVIVSPSSTAVKSFRIGAVINASSTAPLANVFGWQFSISYNATAFLPQGDPSAASLYPDGAANTVLFGAGTTAGTVNWAGLIASNNAFGSSTVSSSGGSGQITVFVTLISPAPAVTLSAKTLLANVNFELLTASSSPQIFTISNVIFVNNSGSSLPGVGPGLPAFVTATNSPPFVHFTASPAGPFGFSFNATATDLDGSVPNPGGYFWDFGDGTQDLGVSGPNVFHDYGVAGKFNVTVRVQDNLGATGAARDSLGNPIFNNQPSHALMSVNAGGAANVPPVALFTFSPTNPSVNQGILFDGSSSFDPDGSIAFWSWNFGDGQTAMSSSPTTNHSYSINGNFTVLLTVTDNGGATGNATEVVHVVALHPTIVVVDTNASSGVVDNNTVVSGPFSISVDVLNVTNLHQWQFTLNFDPSLVATSVGNVTLGPFWQASVGPSTGVSLIQVNQTSVSVFFSLIQRVSFSGTSVLATIHFIPKAAGTLRLHLSNTSLTDLSLAQIPVITEDGIVIILAVPPPDIPPIARFFFTPSSPGVGQTVIFDGSNSTDPDGFITQWAWSFGDGSFTCCGPQAFHSYGSPDNFMVTLTVTDNAGLTASTSETVTVHQKLQHDVAVVSVNAFPRVVVSTGLDDIQVGITNNGLSNENVSVTAFYDSHPIQTINGISLPASNCMNCFFVTYVQILWDTSGVAAGNYTISATVTLATDQNPSDNTLSDGTVTVLPPPILTLTPSSGSLGAKILVQGSGFISPPGEFFGPSFDIIQVSFDDMFIGFAITHTGSFNFTFDVPLAQPGVHQVKALDEIFLTHASANFLVLPSAQANSFSVSVDTGAIYFPGDTATIFALTSLNGVPTSVNSIQITLVRPNGSSVNLNTVQVSAGLYKASFTFPKTGSIGTYVVVAKAHMSGPLDAAAIRSFEVKPSWLSTNGPTIGTTATVAGAIGVVALAWRKGWLRRKHDDPLSFPF